MLIDTHAHLVDEKLKDNIEDILGSAKRSGVEKTISIGCSVKEARASVELAEKYSSVYTTVGLYPHDSGDEEEQKIPLEKRLLEIDGLASHDRVVAIGECGLDYSTPPPWEKERTPEEQDYLFRKQISIARKHNLPVAIHSREATEDTLHILQNEMKKGEFKAVWHCFVDTKGVAKQLVALNIMISFTGIITYPSGKSLHKVVEALPLEKVMVETDAPYLVPQTQRSEGIKVNEPQYVTIVAKKIAEIKGISYDQVAETTTQNAIRFFNLDA